ncbi:hypothetical protein Droror1_Dr00020513 [Drosera rotundifolia]
MLEKQSSEEFLASIDKGKAVIVSLSPQSRTSIAAVFDTSSSRDLSLIEACNEFIARYKQNQSNGDTKRETPLPMLSSACPGWICYAEKTLGSYILPYISSVKIPQQAIGSIIKRHLCQRMGLRGEQGNFNTKIAEVDSVLTSGEVLELIQSKSVDFCSLEESPLDKLLTNVTEAGNLFGVNGSSGGFAETIFRHAAKALFGREIKGPVEFKIVRNSDFREFCLEVDGDALLKFALCYGFRNLQNIVRKIKIGKCDYHFLEVMACPSGCLNGSGQIKPQPGQSVKDLIQDLQKVYMENVLEADPFENPIAMELYDEWLEQPGSNKAKQYLHTEYHPVVKNITSQLHNW